MDSKSPTLDWEQPLWKAAYTRIAGIDEAGRGAWAGPVCAAAVILPPDTRVLHRLDGVRDSKLMTPTARQTWAAHIRATALTWAVGFASSQEIDTIGILPATRLAATRALLSLPLDPSLIFQHSPDQALSGHPSPDLPIPDRLYPDYLLTDYLVFPNIDLPQTALVKGDRLSLSVAAASVLAKTARDAHMCAMDEWYPDYGFARHKGYGTSIHRQALREMGRCEIHRISFKIP